MQRSLLFVLTLFTVIPFTWSQSLDSLKSGDRRQAYLAQILDWLPKDRPGYGRVSYLDSTFGDWLKRTGELPPDFSTMPSIPTLPDPLILDEGGADLQITAVDQWERKKEEMRNQLKKYISGTFPPPPDNLQSRILSETMDGEVKIQMIELSFGPDHQAKLTIELMIPPGDKPLPVFMTQWTHREWAQIAVQRGYIGCVYAGGDSKDDTEDYSRIWAGKYDFTRLMRRAWGGFRAIDYLHTLPFVDRDKIALTGHSRNGKLSLMAAAFDDRIKAVIPSSGGTGAEVPWRYCSYKYDVEDIALLGPAQPSWLHPRLRFFVGRENKLPIDQNSFMALIAPRGLMLSTAYEEGASNPWGIEQAYNSAGHVYDFLSAKDQLALRYRKGKHGTTAEDIEAYVDFFDFVFGRSSRKPEKSRDYTSSFKTWKSNNKEEVNPLDFPQRTYAVPQAGAISVSSKQSKDIQNEIRKNIQWMLGDQPPGVTNPGPQHIKKGIAGEEKFGSVIRRPSATSSMIRLAVSPYSGFGEALFGYLYYPIEKMNRNEKMPVVIYLHEYDYSKGFSSMGFDHNIQGYFKDLVEKGFAVFSFDQLGFGNRQEEGLNFYNRYPKWSKMGKMVADVSSAVDALINLDAIDFERIFVTGYSLGGTVGLYAAALDQRIAGVVSVCGFTSMRTGDKNQLHIRELSEDQVLLPRLSFFQDHADRLPYDYEDLMSAIAPRPALVIAPEYDQYADGEGVKKYVQYANKMYKTLNSDTRIDLFAPNDYNRFSPEMREEVYRWLKN